MKEIANKKLIVLFVAVVLLSVFTVYNRKPNLVESKQYSINAPQNGETPTISAWRSDKYVPVSDVSGIDILIKEVPVSSEIQLSKTQLEEIRTYLNRSVAYLAHPTVTGYLKLREGAEGGVAFTGNSALFVDKFTKNGSITGRDTTESLNKIFQVIFDNANPSNPRTIESIGARGVTIHVVESKKPTAELAAFARKIYSGVFAEAYECYQYQNAPIYLFAKNKSVRLALISLVVRFPNKPHPSPIYISAFYDPQCNRWFPWQLQYNEVTYMTVF